MIILELDKMPVLMICLNHSLIYLMHAIVRKHTTSLIHVKKTHHFCLTLIVWGIGMKENENVKLNS